MHDLTVIYYTGNHEQPEFEARIRQRLWEVKGDIPLISVSQKPIDFGENICVGDVGLSAQNLFRQMQIGIAAAQTKYVCTAESDILHPREYFAFRPPRDDVFYLAMPLWVLFAQSGGARVFCRKERGSESCMVVNRDLVLQRLDEILAPLSQWGLQDGDGDKFQFMLDRRRVHREFFELPKSIVTIKTDRQIHRKTPHDIRSKTRELPDWGSASDLLHAYGL